MRACAHIAERTPGNVGGVFNRGYRIDVCHSGTHVGRPASAIRGDDPQPSGATILLSQRGGQPWESQGPCGLNARRRRQRLPLPKPLPQRARRGSPQSPTLTRAPMPTF
eukprot:5931521-Pyramimonas_sp.AAC.1